MMSREFRFVAKQNKTRGSVFTKGRGHSINLAEKVKQLYYVSDFLSGNDDKAL